MSLEGNLTAFGLSEILQLIAVQTKSGMLSVQSHDRAKVLFFRDGRIISTRDRRNKAKDPLRDYLTRYGVITREDLIRLTHISVQSKLDLTEVIVSEGFLTDEDMKRHHHNHIQEEVHDLLTWEQCTYKFIPGNDIIEGIKKWEGYNIEALLMESMRRIDEFPLMLEMFPSEATRIKKAGTTEEGQELSSTAMRLLGLLEDENRLDYLIANAQVPKFETYEALKQLNEKGCIQVTKTSEATTIDRRVRAKRKRKRHRGPKKNLLPITVALILFAGASIWRTNSIRTEFTSPASRPTADGEFSFNRHRMEEHVRHLLEAYLAQTGRYPSSLKLLEKSGLASEQVMLLIERHSFKYYLTPGGRGYSLL